MKRIMLAATVLVLIGLYAHSAAGSPGQESPQQTRRSLLINTARQIITAEISQAFKTGKFEDWNMLQESDVVHKMGLQLPPQTELRVLADSEGKHFSLALKDAQDTCLYTIFSDESGVVYHGQPVNCPTK